MDRRWSDLGDVNSLLQQGRGDAGAVGRSSLDRSQEGAGAPTGDPVDRAGVARLRRREGGGVDDCAGAGVDEAVGVGAGVGVDADDVFDGFSDDGHLLQLCRVIPPVLARGVAQRHICNESHRAVSDRWWTSF